MTVGRLTEMMGPFDISSKRQSCTRGLWNRRQPLASSRRTDIPPPHWARTWGSWCVSESSVRRLEPSGAVVAALQLPRMVVLTAPPSRLLFLSFSVAIR